MARIDRVWAVCQRLAGLGWRDLLLGALTRAPQDVRLVRRQMADEVLFFTGSPRIPTKHGNAPWKEA